MTTNPFANSMNNEKGVTRAMIYAAVAFFVACFLSCQPISGEKVQVEQIISIFSVMDGIDIEIEIKRTIIK